jgi:uncharacterized membrane protein
MASQGPSIQGGNFVSEEMRLIVCAFDAAEKAEEVEQALEALDRRLETIKLGNIAIIERTAEGQVSFRESKDHRNVVSQVTGMVAGAASWLIYAFAGSLGYQAGPAAYSVSYNTAERLIRDSGFYDEALREIGEHLDAGSSALITLVTAEEEPVVVEEIERLGGRLIQQEVGPELLAELTQKEQG